MSRTASFQETLRVRWPLPRGSSYVFNKKSGTSWTGRQWMCVCVWGEHFCPKGQDPWHPRDPRPGWVCVFKQELLDWPLHLGDREVRTLKPMSQKNSPEKCWLLANVRSAGTGGGGAESQRKSDSHSVRSPFQPCLGSCLREDEGGLGLAAEFRHAKASELQGRVASDRAWAVTPSSPNQASTGGPGLHVKHFVLFRFLTSTHARPQHAGAIPPISLAAFLSCIQTRTAKLAAFRHNTASCYLDPDILSVICPTMCRGAALRVRQGARYLPGGSLSQTRRIHA